MKNPLVVYALVAIASFAILFTALFLIFRPKTHTPPKVAKSATSAESTLTVGDSLHSQADSLNQAPGLGLAEFRKKVEALYSDKNLTKRYTKTQIDSILKGLVAQIDSLETGQGSYKNYIAYQNTKLNSLRDSLRTLRENNATLEKTVAGMKAQRSPGVPSIAAQKPVIQPSKSLQELASTYNAMKPDRVAQLLSGMSDDKAIEILRKMSERKRAKVLEVMPLAKASSLVARMAG
jgi:flagellar motility protein MotE (MotC chaperone)